jgi:TrmH family RNA methyltransferase
MKPATSAKDPRVIRAAALLRGGSDGEHFALDSEPLLEGARAAGLAVDYVLSARKGTEPFFARASADAMRALAFAGETPDVVAVVRLPKPPDGPLPAGSLVLAGVADAGNVGAIIRTAAALELPRVALTPGCADPWSRKALRASLGAAFAPGLVVTGRPLERLAAEPDRPPLIAAVPRGGMAPEALPPGACVVLGSERDGLTPGERACCDLEVTVSAAGFESLNVAAAAAILSYVLKRRATGADDER